MILIDASKVYRRLTELVEEDGDSTFISARDVLNDLLCARVVDPVKHRKWINGESVMRDTDGFQFCPYCGAYFNYCQNCGAQMERNEE